jgi:hypothetical protein
MPYESRGHKFESPSIYSYSYVDMSKKKKKKKPNKTKQNQRGKLALSLRTISTIQHGISLSHILFVKDLVAILARVCAT